ncbi:MAG: hypothetical protein IKE34_08645 [Paenibacillus sp.]|nr:hypothetical protein [Paenibacillus aquistagni]MBR2569240.1 hypothetical protein [Paenibacillus sp.]NMM51554.1 hypothetical protein [Paenibacillus aquistagni]
MSTWLAIIPLQAVILVRKVISPVQRDGILQRAASDPASMIAAAFGIVYG